MEVKPKKNLIFLHLPKNGGATFNALLNRIYYKEVVHQIRLKDKNTLTTEDFIELPEKDRARIKVLKGHMFYGLHEHLIGPSEYITFLRQPEKRILSFYNFVQERPNHRLYDKVVGNNMSFAKFVEEMDTADIHNAQVRYISGLPDADESLMLTTAIENIEKHFAFVGLQELYDESLILLKNYYGWGIPYYTFKNKAQNPKTRKIVDPKTKALIEKKNRADLELHAYIEKKIIQALEKTKSLDSDLYKLNLANKFANNRIGLKLLKKFKL